MAENKHGQGTSPNKNSKKNYSNANSSSDENQKKSRFYVGMIIFVAAVIILVSLIIGKGYMDEKKEKEEFLNNQANNFSFSFFSSI